VSKCDFVIKRKPQEEILRFFNFKLFLLLFSLERMMKFKLENEIKLQELLAGNFGDGDSIKISVSEKGKLVFSKQIYRNLKYFGVLCAHFLNGLVI